MHANVLPISPLFERHGFELLLKGAVGFGILVTAATGTMLAWLGHPAGSDVALYAAAAVGTACGAAAGYRASRPR